MSAYDLADAFVVAEHREDETDDSLNYPQFARDDDARAFAAAYIAFVKAVTELGSFGWIDAREMLFGVLGRPC